MNGSIQIKEANSKYIFEGKFINGNPENTFLINKKNKINEFIKTKIKNNCFDDSNFEFFVRDWNVKGPI